MTKAVRKLAALGAVLAAWLPLACGAALVACGAPPAEPPPPVHPRAALLLEPPVVALGQVADVELAVVTPPGVTVQPFALPSAVPGFAVVGREPQETAREPARWVHRTRLRLRAMQVGRFEIPAGSVRVEDAEGSVEALPYAALPLEVVSTLPEHGARVAPYGIRTLSGGRDDLGTLVALAAGAALALTAVGVVALARRRTGAPPSEPPVSPEAPPWHAARDALQAAREAAARDPRGALDRAARTLRRYAAQRFGGDAPVRTTPELADATPPFALTTRWRGFVALLEALDAARFPGGAPPEADLVRRLIDEARAFVDATVPPGAPR